MSKKEDDIDNLLSSDQEEQQPDNDDADFAQVANTLRSASLRNLKEEEEDDPYTALQKIQEQFRHQQNVLIYESMQRDYVAGGINLSQMQLIKAFTQSCKNIRGLNMRDIVMEIDDKIQRTAIIKKMALISSVSKANI